MMTFEIKTAPPVVATNGFDDLQAHVVRTHRVLSLTRDLSPANDDVCTVLTRLFTLTTSLADHGGRKGFISRFDKDFLERFRALLSNSESEMESYWADEFIGKGRLGFCDIEKFIYWKNYEALVDRELALLAREKFTAANVCFVGQGPLPMTMFMFRKATGLACEGIDICPDATGRAQRLSDALGLSRCAFTHICGTKNDYTQNDIVFVASLVPEKDEVIAKIKADRKDKPTLIFVRTAEELSCLYYAPYLYRADDMKLVGKTDYSSDCINTTLLYRYN